MNVILSERHKKYKLEQSYYDTSVFSGIDVSMSQKLCFLFLNLIFLDIKVTKNRLHTERHKTEHLARFNNDTVQITYRSSAN